MRTEQKWCYPCFNFAKLRFLSGTDFADYAISLPYSAKPTRKKVSKEIFIINLKNVFYMHKSGQKDFMVFMSSVIIRLRNMERMGTLHVYQSTQNRIADFMGDRSLSF